MITKLSGDLGKHLKVKDQKGGIKKKPKRQPKIKDCPFCGGEGIAFKLTLSNHAVFCKVCISSGRWERAKKDAIAAWNRRVR